MKKKRKRAGSIKDNTTAVVWAGPAVGEVVAKKEGGGETFWTRLGLYGRLNNTSTAGAKDIIIRKMAQYVR
jgi:hypothetical protein